MSGEPAPAQGARRQGAVGARRLRVEDGRLLTGRGRFVADVRLPRMVELAFVRSTQAHARLAGLEVGLAERTAGVLTVLTSRDIPAVTLSNARHPALLATPQPVLAVDRVRFVGEPVAAVVAADRYHAEDAAELVDVDYDVWPFVGEVGASDRPAVAPLFDDIADNVIFRDSATAGDVAGEFAAAAHVATATLRFHRQVACPLEPRGCLADYDPSSGALRVWSSTQSPHRLQRDLAAAVGLAENRVSVVMHDIGGAFGQKIPTHVEEVVTTLAAIRLGRPVRWLEDRQENLLAAPHSRDQLITVRLALDAELRFTAMHASVAGDAGAYSFNSGSALTEGYRAARSMPGPYRVANFGYQVSIGVTNKSPVAPYRGVGLVAAQAARELVIDKAARQLGVDRFELRRRNLVASEELPYTTAMGMVFADTSFVESLDQAERMLRAVPALAGDGSVLVGIGISPYVEPSGIGTEGGFQLHGHHSPSHDSARVSLDTSGTAVVSVGTPSLGTGLETTLAQIAADVIGIRADDVTVAWTDTANAPLSLTGTRGSRAAVVAGGAVAAAAGEVRDQLRRLAADLLGTDPTAITIDLGVARAPGGRALTVRELAKAGFGGRPAASRARLPTLSATRAYDPAATYSNACVVAVVGVHTDTGKVEVRRIIGVEDCGTVINPMIVEGQFAGAVAQAVGAATLERMVYDTAGQPMTSTLMDYLLPTATDTVPVESAHIETPSSSTWGGVKGVGESGMIGTVAAIAAAVTDALGGPGDTVQVPLQPETVWRMLRDVTG